MKKKALSMFLALVMILCIMPIEVFAGNKCSVSTLDELLSADKSDGMISVEKDIVISTDVDLELNNTKIYYATDPSTSVDTKIIIESTGSLTVTSKEEGSKSGMDIQIDNYGTLKVSGCELAYGVNNYGTITSGEFNCAVNNNGTISGGMYYTPLTNTGEIDGLTVTYKNGGTQYAMEVLQSGGNAAEPVDPLDGTGEATVWYSDEACTTVYDFNTPVTGNITLYGQKDTQGPTITGIEDGKTYCAIYLGIKDLLFSVTDNDQVASVTINGTVVAPYSPDFYKITEDMFTDGTDVTVTATDVSGNATSVTVTLYKDHNNTFYSKNGKYWYVCSQCGEKTTGEKNIPYSTFDGQAMTCGSDTYTFTVYPATRSDDKKSSATLPLEITTDIENFSGEVSTVDNRDGLSYTVTITGIPTDCTGFKVILKQKEQVIGFTFDEEYEVSVAHELTRVEGKSPTTTEEGNKEYWYCSVCKKYFSDADAANVIPDGKDGVVIAKLPVITKGDGQTVTVGEKKSLEFTSDAAYTELRYVLIDGKELDTKNYTAAAAADGSTVITLKANYVATLSNGEHTIGIVSESGTATVKFTVNKKAAETTTTTKKSATGGTKAPQTGDNSNISLWLALLLVSSSAVTAATIASKKKKYNG